MAKIRFCEEVDTYFLSLRSLVKLQNACTSGLNMTFMERSKNSNAGNNKRETKKATAQADALKEVEI